VLKNKSHEIGLENKIQIDALFGYIRIIEHAGLFLTATRDSQKYN
jgi:hypothetical protein